MIVCVGSEGGDTRYGSPDPSPLALAQAVLARGPVGPFAPCGLVVVRPRSDGSESAPYRGPADAHGVRYGPLAEALRPKCHDASGKRVRLCSSGDSYHRLRYNNRRGLF